MSILHTFEKMQLISHYIEKRSTGTQKEFAKKLGISRSMLNRYLKEMKSRKFPIRYCKIRKTYYYQEPGKMTEKLFVQEMPKEEMRKINGGFDIELAHLILHESKTSKNNFRKI
ncbi:MAG: helix-turn-helix domain-containing protein [Bacteroidetes bacterium]|nr:helix-turn-helix domain-containing protein [Bacteroidota bacterium]